MKVFLRILTIVLLAAFAAGTVAHAASAAVMTVKMALADAGSMDSADCDGCSGDGDGAPSCDGVCAEPLVATVEPGTAVHGALEARIRSGAARHVIESSGPPDLSPPRSIVLS